MDNPVQETDETKPPEVKDVAVIGLGPSGVAASMELIKGGYQPVAYEAGLIGGQINMTANIRNYPGFSGPATELANNFAVDVKTMGLKIIHSFVKSITLQPDGVFKVATLRDTSYYRAVIVATGTRYRPYGVPDTGTDQKVRGHGFSRCAICDGPLYRGKDVMVVGGGESAFQEGLYLASICNHVTLINRRDVFRAYEKDVKAFRARPNTTIITPAVTVSCSGNGHLEHVVIKDPNDPTDSTLRTLDVEGCFIYIGADAATGFVDIPQAKDEQGNMKVDEDMKVTAVKGLLGSGDVIDTPLRQVATAVGYGARAGVSATRYLKDGTW